MAPRAGIKTKKTDKVNILKAENNIPNNTL